MTILFKDTFQGSGAITAHTPDISVANTPNDVWAGSGNVGASGLSALSGTAGYAEVFFPASVDYSPEYFDQYVVASGWKLTWVWRPLVDMLDDTSPRFVMTCGDSLYVQCAIDGAPNSQQQLSFGDNTIEIAYVANQDYVGTITAVNGLQTLKFLGKTLQTFDTSYTPPDAPVPLDWSGLYAYVTLTAVLRSIQVETYGSNSQWTGFRNAYEAS